MTVGPRSYGQFLSRYSLYTAADRGPTSVIKRGTIRLAYVATRPRLATTSPLFVSSHLLVSCTQSLRAADRTLDLFLLPTLTNRPSPAIKLSGAF